MAKRHMTIAKADFEDLQAVRHFLMGLEAACKDFQLNEDDIAEFVLRYFPNVDFRWRRVIWAADLLIDRVCDPQLDYLALNSQILEGLTLRHGIRKRNNKASEFDWEFDNDDIYD